jgi:hypothetical protein
MRLLSIPGSFLSWSITFAVLVLACYLHVQSALWLSEAPLHATLPLFPTSLQDRAPVELTHLSAHSGELELLQFGRWRGPVHFPVLPPTSYAQTLLQRKEWVFLSANDDRYLIGIALGSFQYLGFSFSYLFDAQNPTEFLIQESRFPLGLTSKVAESGMLSGCWEYVQNDLLSLVGLSAPAFLRFCGRGDSLHMSAHARVRLRSRLNQSRVTNLDYSVDVRPEESLSVSYPVGEQRPVFTEKLGGLKCSNVSLLLDDKAILPAAPLLCQLDFSRGFFPRLTIWYWVNVAWQAADGTRLGLQLSTGLYRDVTGKHSYENALWVNGKLHILDQPLQWYPPDMSQLTQSSKRSRNREAFCSAAAREAAPKGVVVRAHPEDVAAGGSESLRLSFQPLHDMHGAANVGSLLDVDLHHMVGLYSGFVRLEGKTYKLPPTPVTATNRIAA